MAEYKAVNAAKLDNALTAMANAIREKKGTETGIPWNESTGFASEIQALSLAVIEALTVTGNGTYTAPDGIDGYNPVKVEIPTVEQATPSITVSSSGLITASAEQGAGLVAEGEKSATKQLTTKSGTTITPTSSVQTAVSAGTYVTGDIKVAAASSVKLKTGSFTPSSNVSSQSITHNLGAVPNFGMFLVSGTDDPSSDYYDFILGLYYNGVMAMFRDINYGRIQFYSGSPSASTSSGGYAHWITSATSTTLKMGHVSMPDGTCYFRKSQTYQWLFAKI